MLELSDIKDNNSNSQYRICGIYGIYLNNNLVYIGKSTNIIKRWVTHKHHIMKREEERMDCLGDYYKIYVELRNAMSNGDKITFDIIENVNDKTLLGKKEKKYLKYNKPIFNIKDY